MNLIILILCLLVILFIGLIIYGKPTEKFINVVGNTQLQGNSDGVGPFSLIVIDDTTEEGYDLELLGPKCLSVCVAEHGPNFQFTNPDGHVDALHWNRQNPTKGYCYRANSREYPFNCDSSCQEKCGNDLNNPEQSQGRYDPDQDFSQCVIDEGNCVENTLNALSGHSCLSTVGCKMCIDKYIDNLNVLQTTFENEIQEQEQCPA